MANVTLTAAFTYTDHIGHATTSTKTRLLTLSASSVKGGTSLTGTITLSGTAAVDTAVTVGSTNPAAMPMDARGVRSQA